MKVKINKKDRTQAMGLFSIRLSEHHANSLRKHAELQRRPLSNLMRIIIEDYLNALNKTP